ncbi:OmpA family protein [Caballeronia sp.]|uniref:OmpA family protein n=1 Tax=Caballeronia sp. TaxID=1931223 RepID=UPI003C5965FE
MDSPSGNKRLVSGKTGYEQDGDAETNSARWLISYADLITTLMVLFLALYVLQLAKYKELEIKTFERHIVKERTDDAHANDLNTVTGGPEAARKNLLSLLGTLRDKQQITIVNGAPGVEIGINAKILFNSGDAHLLPESFDVLNQVALILRNHSTNNILVEGHTDSLPISTAKYESNWELSSARAGAVVRFLVDRGIEPNRLAAIGRADNFPLVMGDNANARTANRRVTILVQY